MSLTYTERPLVTVEDLPSNIATRIAKMNEKYNDDGLSLTPKIYIQNGKYVTVICELLTIAEKVAQISPFQPVIPGNMAFNPAFPYNASNPPYAPLSTTINIPQMIIPHVQGTQTVACGVGIPFIGAGMGVGINSNGTIDLDPDSTRWRSENMPATALALRVETNILPADLSGTLPNDQHAVFVWRQQAYFVSAGSTTQGQRETCMFSNNGYYTGGQNANGMLAQETSFNYPNAYWLQLGTGGFDRFYYTFGIQIPATAATKDYTFDIKLDFN